MEKVWLKNYQTGVPYEIDPNIYPSLVDMFEDIVRKYRDKRAFGNFGTTLTFKELEKQSRHFAAFLQSRGMKKGDRLALMLPNILQFPISMFGALLAGVVVVPVNPLYTARELLYQLKDSNTKAIVVFANVAHTLEEVTQELDLDTIIVTELGDCFPFPKSLIYNFVVRFIKKMIPPWFFADYYSFKEALSIGKENVYKKPEITGDDLAYLQYTGGTTGLAKGAMLSHRNMVANIEQARVWVEPNIEEGREIIITALPLYHIFSLTANCYTFMRCGSFNALITNPRDIKSFIHELKRYRFTAITGVNTLFNALLNQPSFAEVDRSGLHITLGGGMAVQKSVADRWKSVTGIPLIEAYGLTEACPAVCINPLNMQDFNESVGLPVSSTDVSIRDDQNNELGFGEKGELCVRGPQVMQGYWNKPQETEIALKGGWLHTGDIATIDGEGFVRIVDRKKDIIFISGFNVYPTEVEEIISMIPEVAEVAVIGVPTDVGELVKAFIVKKDPKLTAQQVIEHCRKLLTPYKIPKEIEFRTELPKTNVGKILKRALRSEPKNGLN